MRAKRHVISLCLALALLLALTPGCGDGEEVVETGVPTILIMHSYHPEYDWVQEVNEGFNLALERARWAEGVDYNLDVYYMDTKRNPSPEFKTQAGIDALAYVDDTQPDVVIAIADDALEYFGVKMLGRETPVLFAAVNNDPVTDYGVAESLERPGKNISGVLQRARFEGTLEILHGLYPEARRMALLADDSSVPIPHLRYYAEQAREHGIEVVMEERIGQFERWKQAVAEANQRADFIMIVTYFTLRQPDGSHITGADVMEWTLANTTLPTAAFAAFMIRDDGILLGDGITGVEQARAVMEMAIRVLNGVPVGTIPIISNVDGARLINETTAERLGLTIPEGLRRSCEIVR